jgi:hypothetical protein
MVFLREIKISKCKKCHREIIKGHGKYCSACKSRILRHKKRDSYPRVNLDEVLAKLTEIVEKEKFRKW